MVFMNRFNVSLRSVAMLLVAGACLTGCVQQPKTLYQWGSYQPEVYEYFKGESKEAQVAKLEEDLQKIRSTNATPPPGYHAQLGMLYGSIGKDDQMVQELRTEKALFPESATYMDFLLKNAHAGVVK
ncbi:putative lipoprotein [Pseudomonas syringae pv. actinidiae]|uniref:Putative lipoprotein n=2 Tax=Pseudomonas TaxID=286 RepID=A0A7Z6UNM1_PSESF|nr:putative lipoprotein [Pseudomonas syringae pv. actinidiae]RMQ08243.1 putative lipoprotein [Pseudomonas viridiflava]RMR61912.1 putative lipoprotein [Pseudomonas syringae pv. actinidiae]